MIFNMSYWQSELRRLSGRLRRHATQRRWAVSSDPSVEKSVMLGFYAVRKMLQSFNPPPLLESPPSIRVTAFPRSSTRIPPSHIFWPEVAEAFDLARPRAETLNLKDACNQVIHSHFFSLWLGPDRTLRGVFVCSDKLREEKIFRIDLDEIIKLFDSVAESRRKVAPMKFAPENNRVTM